MSAPRGQVAGVDVNALGEAVNVRCFAKGEHAKGARATLRPAAGTVADACGGPWWSCRACGRRYSSGEVSAAQRGNGIARSGVVARPRSLSAADPSPDGTECGYFPREAPAPELEADPAPLPFDSWTAGERFTARMRPFTDAGPVEADGRGGDLARWARHPDGSRFRSFAFCGRTAMHLRWCAWRLRRTTAERGADVQDVADGSWIVRGTR